MIFASIPTDVPPTLVNFYHDISKSEWNPVYAKMHSRVLWTPRQQYQKFMFLESCHYLSAKYPTKTFPKLSEDDDYIFGRNFPTLMHVAHIGIS